MYDSLSTRDLFDVIRRKTQICAKLGIDPSAVSGLIADVKREARRRCRAARESRVFHDTGDSYIEVVAFPQDVTTREQAEAYFDAYMRRDYIPSQYDCTGQVFTRYHHIGVLDGKITCWHWVSIDI